MQINVITAGIFDAKWVHMSLFVDRINDNKLINSSLSVFNLINLWDAAGGQEDAVVGHHGA